MYKPQKYCITLCGTCGIKLPYANDVLFTANTKLVQAGRNCAEQ